MRRTLENFERLLAFHGGPAMAGIKPANLISCSKETYTGTEIEGLLAYYNRKLNASGIFFEILCSCKTHTLLLVYRKSKLQAALLEQQTKWILRTAGYPDADDVMALLSHLKRRLAEQNGFPHEIGLFLGYPPEDVLGFQIHKGQNYLLCGHWKVYSDPVQAQKRFACYDRCRKAVCRRVLEGRSLTQLFSVA